MATIATLAIKLIADAGAYLATMDEAEKKSQTWSANVSRNLKDAGGKLTDFGKGMSTYVTAPILGAGVAAITFASDMEETKSKVNVVFGSMSKDVLTWSENAATALGQSREQALGAAATYGNLFVSLGLGQQPAAEMSMNLVQLASDLASFNNANPQDVLDALRSGLSGEVEPLKKYGVAMNEAILKQKAMELGLGDNIQGLTEAQKLQLRYAIIMDQTATAQGDFARTADGLANSTRIAKAQLADSAVTIGQMLLPYAVQLLGWVRDAIAWFQQLTPEQQKWIVVLLGIAAAIGPVIMVLGGLISGIGAIIGVLGAVTTPMLIVIGVILLIAGAIYLLYLAWTNNWGGIQEKTAAALAFIQGLIDGGMQFINDLSSGKLGWLSQLWNNTLAGIQIWWQLFTTNIQLMLQAFTAAFHGDWYTFGEKMRMVWDNMWTGIQAILQIAWENTKIIFSTMITSIIAFFTETDWNAVGRAIVEGIARGLEYGSTVVVNAAINAANAALQAVQGFLGIHSPSQVLAMQVGLPMAEGVAVGWEQGLDSMLAPSFDALVPAGAPVMPGVTAPANGGERGGGLSGNDAVVALLQEILDSVGIDYEKLARVLRDGILMRGDA